MASPLIARCARPGGNPNPRTPPTPDTWPPPIRVAHPLEWHGAVEFAATHLTTPTHPQACGYPRKDVRHGLGRPVPRLDAKAPGASQGERGRWRRTVGTPELPGGVVGLGSSGLPKLRGAAGVARVERGGGEGEGQGMRRVPCPWASGRPIAFTDTPPERGGPHALNARHPHGPLSVFVSPSLVRPGVCPPLPCSPLVHRPYPRSPVSWCPPVPVER